MSFTANCGLESSKHNDYFKNMCNEYLSRIQFLDVTSFEESNVLININNDNSWNNTRKQEEIIAWIFKHYNNSQYCKDYCIDRIITTFLQVELELLQNGNSFIKLQGLHQLLICSQFFNEENKKLVKFIGNKFIENIILNGNTFGFNKLLRTIPNDLLANIHMDNSDIDEPAFTAFLNNFFVSYEVNMLSDYQHFNILGNFYNVLPRYIANKLIVSLSVDEALVLLEKENTDIIHLLTKVKSAFGEISKELNNENISSCINECYLEIEDLLRDFLNIDYEFDTNLKIECFSKLLKLKTYKSSLINLYHYLFMLHNDEVSNKVTIEVGIRNLKLKYRKLASGYIKTAFSKDILMSKFDRILYAFINDSIDFTNLYTFIRVHYGYVSLCDFLIWFGQNFREYSFEISNSFIEETEKYFLSLDIYEIKQMNPERINYTGNISIDFIFDKIKNRSSNISVIINKVASIFINMNEYVYMFGSLAFKIFIGVSVAIFIIYICFLSGLVAAL